ncbi:MAG: spondin domain-containing protein [Pseudomonadota bacterium]
MTELRISVKNLNADGGVFTTPFWFGFHNNSFDLFNSGEAASGGLEQLAEDGGGAGLTTELVNADADGQTATVASNTGPGPIAPGETASTIVNVDGASNAYVNYAAMILPSNDAFVGNNAAQLLFSPDGKFLGAHTSTITGAQVYDAGTEVNTELDAAFINQTGPNTGVDENGVVALHPGFNGSLGNPDSDSGDQIILGGTNAFGEFIDPIAADFTQPGHLVAQIHINTVKETEGTDGRDKIIGGKDDDLVSAGDGRDFVFGRAGWDVLDGGNGRDFLSGGRGNDELHGGHGRDVLLGGRDHDYLSGGHGRDILKGGEGSDVLSGDAGNDFLRGGWGEDTFVFTDGDGHDFIADFKTGVDQLALDVSGIETFSDVLDAAENVYRGVELDFGDSGSIFLRNVDVAWLSEDDFLFA